MEAVSKSDVASEAYDNATSSNYVSLCNAYKNALQNEINACGDPDGDLQNIIDNLGDCGSTPAPSVTVTVGTLEKTFETNRTVTVVGTTRKIKVYDNVNNSDFVYFEIQQGATGVNKINNFNIHLISSDYNPMPVDEGGNWTSNITTNTTTKINGTFSGYVTSPTTGADLSLTQGIININL
ncbi:MAG: hypothetical protein U0X58_02190 [Flavobacteriaceae bacterium]